jgi:hypothetical protein
VSPLAYVPPDGFVTDQRIIYSDGLHNENTEMIALDDRIVLIFRGGETAQIGSNLAHINVYASTDQGKTFVKQSEVSGAALPGMRDIRDPKLVEMNGKLYLYAISRLPGGHYRDLFGEAWTVRAESSDHGVTWTDPVKTFTDLDANGKESFWGFWRFTKRSYTEGGATKQTLYALGYGDGDVDVGMFASDDGINWEKRSTVISSYDDVPSEAELQFFGDNQETAVAIVRLDNQGILQDGQSAICTAQAPFTSWECGRRIEQRLDGPTWISPVIDGVRKSFVVARKHLPCTFKRTAVYELRGDLANPSAKIEVCEVQELSSAGDTAYTALAPLGDERYLMSWYSSVIPKKGDVPWLVGQFGPSDIWLADLDLRKNASTCHSPPKKEQCGEAPIPDGDLDNASSGTFLLTVAPIIFPEKHLSFQAVVTVQDKTLHLALQPLDAATLAPAGSAFQPVDAAIDDSGQFAFSFPSEYPPEAAFPAFADPFLELRHLEFRGALRTKGTFCGTLRGTAQVLGTSPSDAIDLRGSTFGAVLWKGASSPTPSTGCPVTTQ